MAAAASPQTKASPQQTAAAQNSNARSLIYNNAQPIFQTVTTKSFTNVAAGNNVLTVNPLQVGFLMRFVVYVTAVITNTSAAALAITPNGADNLVSNFTFSDFTGNPRHNASGRAFSYVEAAKYRRIPGAAYTSDSVSGFGSIVKSNVAPATVAESATATVTRVFEIPVMIDTGMNMTGGMWLGVNNQSTLLTVTLNPLSCGAASADPLTYIYTGNAAATITSATITVYQHYWNNVPLYGSGAQAGQPILPQTDLSTAYMITETSSGLSFAAGQVASWNYPTFSKILGTYITYDNDAALNPGTDITQIAAVVSNRAWIRQYDPYTLDRVTRDVIGTSFPSGTYGLITRTHPFDVSQYPSLQLQIQPTTATNAYAMITTELTRPIQYLNIASGTGGA